MRTLQFDDPRHRTAAGHQRRVPGLEKLLHPRHGLFAEPALLVAVDDVSVGIDEAGHHGHAAASMVRMPWAFAPPRATEAIRPFLDHEGTLVHHLAVIETLRPLLDLQVDLMLPTHGAPTDRAALERALS